MKQETLLNAIEKLSKIFSQRDWPYLDVPAVSKGEKMFAWPGTPEEDIMICVHKDTGIHELFHRQDFFFFNFAYEGDYGAISYQCSNHITVHEGECYIGQPFAGYALYGDSDKEITIIGVLIQKEAFFRTFLPVLSSNEKLFHFFLIPQTNQYSDEFIQLKFENECSVRHLLEMMVIEYAASREDTQSILKPLALTLFMYVARQYSKTYQEPVSETVSSKILKYMSEHTGTVTLKEIAAHFSYHPNYISSLLRRETGYSFSEILLTQRMNRASALLKGTNLPIEEISAILGYSNSSNFYKAFREYYNCSPREYIISSR